MQEEKDLVGKRTKTILTVVKILKFFSGDILQTKIRNALIM